MPDAGAVGDAGDAGEADVTMVADTGALDAAVGAEAGDDGGDGAGPSMWPANGTPPALLSQAGLFSSIAADGGLVLANGVQEYTPAYALWADGATKKRWIYLPPGTKIDTTDMNHWSFPVGTKFFKEFDLAQRLETRMIWRYGPGPDDFVYVTYRWSAEAGIPTDAEMADPTNGEPTVDGTPHDIPPVAQCQFCHVPLQDHVLGFGAIELNHATTPALPGATVASLMAAKTLTTNPRLADLAIPGDATAQAALGYLHANCGNCHNVSPGIGIGPPPLNFRLDVGTKTVETSNTYVTAVNQPTTNLPEYMYRIAGGDTMNSAVSNGMANRAADVNAPDPRAQMPPWATKVVDTAGSDAVNKWIATLPKPP
jgi:hypothetical protein